jgi:hypothetical protein
VAVTETQPSGGHGPAESSLEGWAPEIRDAEMLAEVLDRAFDYRGDVTIATVDGEPTVGYVFNRNRDVAEPYLQVFPAAGGPALTIPYARIRRVVFSGKDTAAGNSYAAWLRRREAERAAMSARGA